MIGCIHDGKFLRLFNAMGNNWEFQVRRANVRFESGKDSESFEYVPYESQLALKLIAPHAISTLLYLASGGGAGQHERSHLTNA